MNIRVLNYFLMVAREENITKAAQLLHMTQPTLSRQLMQLEEELGVKLFQRSNHSVFLTNEGMMFRRRARDLVALAEKAQRELLHKEELAGVIAVGCGEMRSAQELAKLFTGFQEMHPLVKFELYSGNNEDIKERMEQGTLDIGLLLEPVNIVNYEFIRMKTKEQWGVLIHKDAKLASQHVIQPGDLIGTLVVTVHINTPLYRKLANWAGDIAKNMEPCVNYDQLYNAVIVARERKGAAICIKLDCHFDDMKFLPLEPKLELSSVLAWKEQKSCSKITDAFIQYVRAQYR